LVNNKEKNKKAIMESKKEFVTAEELNQYSLFLKDQMDSMRKSIEEVRNSGATISESEEGYVNNLEERVAKLEKYSDYLAENLESAISYGEYLADNLDKSISYSKYLAENLDKTISYSNYLAENVDKNISYSEYIAENVDKNIEYSKYIAEKLDQNIQYSEYLAENLESNIEYSEYLAENIDDNIQYAEYIAENLDNNISYSEYIAENLSNSIDYSEYVAESLSKSISYSEYLAESLNKTIDKTEAMNEKLQKNISYSEYIAESVNAEFGNTNQTENLNESIDLAHRTSSTNSGFAGNYDDLSARIDNLISSVQTQKTEINEGVKAQRIAETQKAEGVLNENEEVNEAKTGMKFIDEIPEEYATIWESLNEGHKQSIIAQSNFYKLETPYQIRNFWTTRQLGVAPIGLQKLNENQNTEEGNLAAAVNKAGYTNDYLEAIARSLESRFKN